MDISGASKAQLGEEDFDEEEVEDEDKQKVIEEFAHAKIMERAHLAIYKRLMQQLERVSGALKDKETVVNGLKVRKEDVGVELYSMQQQLARLQMGLEQTHAQFNTLQEQRRQAEESLVKAKADYSAKKQALDDHNKLLLKNQSELNSINETINQVEKYNEEMKSEIASQRRAAYKAEEAVGNLEKEKKTQDIFIDSLTEQLKRAEDQIAMYEQQLEAQRQQTQDADRMLKETAAEMELISFEKKQLMQQWQSSLIGMARRDEALTVAQKALKEAQNASRDYDLEIDGIKREIQKAQTEHETLDQMKDRLQNETKFVEEQAAKVNGEREQLAERYTMLQRSMTQTEDEEKKIELEINQLKQQVENLQQNIQTVTRERQKLEEGIAANKNTQTTVSKAVKNLRKQEAEILAVVHEKEIESSQYNNEMARIKVDSLNTEAHNVQLRDTLQKLVDELKSKDALIEKYQLEIRQRNDEIEKKMYRVDRLNRKYEKLMENVDDIESMGPLESTIRHLQKEIEAVGAEVDQMQHEWLTDQTTLVHTVSETEELLEKNAELKAKVSILSQKRLRQLQEVEQHKEEIKRLDATIQAMHKDMVRLNDLIGKNSNAQQDLANQNFVLEKEFIEELRELEAESLTLEAKVQEIKTLKSEILEEIIETERQVMLWEKKIQIERETQAALDPQLGMAEAKSMEKEIHRMKLRLETLKHEQERLLQDMEVAIMKREQIAVRYQGKKNGPQKGKKTEEYTKAGLKKKIASLKKQLKTTATETGNFSFAVQERKQQISDLTRELEKATSRYGNLEENANRLQTDINSKLYEKQRMVEITNMKQRMMKKFQEMEAGTASPVQDSDSLQVENGLLESEQKLAAVRGIISTLQGKFDHLDEVLGRVLQLTETVDSTDQN